MKADQATTRTRTINIAKTMVRTGFMVAVCVEVCVRHVVSTSQRCIPTVQKKGGLVYDVHHPLWPV